MRELKATLSSLMVYTKTEYYFPKFFIPVTETNTSKYLYDQCSKLDFADFIQSEVNIITTAYCLLLCRIFYIMIKDLYNYINSLPPEPELDEPDVPCVTNRKSLKRRTYDDVEKDTKDAIKRRKESLRSFKAC